MDKRTSTSVNPSGMMDNNVMDGYTAQREQENYEAAMLAAKKHTAGFSDFGQPVKTFTKEELLADTNRAQMEADALKLQLKQKENEAQAFKIQARTLEEHERDIREREASAGQPPKFTDRVKSGWEGVKDTFTTTTTAVGQKANEAGAATSEAMANIKEGFGHKMEQLGESLQVKGQQTKVDGAKNRDQALERKGELEERRADLEAHAAAQLYTKNFNYNGPVSAPTTDGLPNAAATNLTSNAGGATTFTHQIDTIPVKPKEHSA